MTNRRIRVIERWGLVAGVTGVAANVLLIALYALALPDVGDFDWTGPANDVMGGIVSTGQRFRSAVVLMLGWTAVIGLAGATTRSLPPVLARLAVAIGVSGCLGMVLVGSSVLVPLESVVQYVGGAGLLIGVPALLAFPIWLILLSNRLRGHLDETEEASLPIGDQVVSEAMSPVINRRAR